PAAGRGYRRRARAADRGQRGAGTARGRHLRLRRSVGEVRVLSGARRGAVWTGERSDEGRRRTGAPREAARETQRVLSGAGRGAVWTEERSDEGRRRTRAPREAARETQRVLSGAGRGAVWTEERSDEGRRRTRAPREAARETQ